MTERYDAAALASWPLFSMASDLLLLLHACYASLLNAASGMQPVLFTQLLMPGCTVACKCTMQAINYD
jgi:hypothetical protein